MKRISKVLLSLALVLVMVLPMLTMTGCDLFGGNNDTQLIEKIDKLNNEISSLRSQINETQLTETIDKLNNEIASLRTQINDLQDEVEALVYNDISGTTWKFKDTLTNYLFLPTYSSGDSWFNDDYSLTYEMSCDNIYNLSSNESIGFCKYYIDGVGFVFSSYNYVNDSNYAFVYGSGSTLQGFSDGWYVCQGVDLNTAIKLVDTPTIHIISGNLATNKIFIKWLLQNAVQIS